MINNVKVSKNKKKNFKVSLIFFIITLLFFYLPLLVLIVSSFNESKTMNFTGVSLKWYKSLIFDSGSLWNSFLNSIIIAISSATVSTILGTLGAIGLYWYNFKLKRYIQIVSYLPLILPEITIGVALLIFFSWIKIKLGLFTIFLAHVTFNIPFVLLIVISRLSEFDYSIIEAAYDLGAREIDALLKVIIPMTIPGIISGFLIAITLSLDDFVITFFVSGPGSSTLPLHIYSMIRFGVSPVVNALSVALIIATSALTLSTRKINKYMFS
ncbi:MAG TPA: ABC transporter permease [Spirochaetota bacterium]|nr:MAG: Inner membrane ABC transporter permease protein YdcV [Spirochaetes bacterium ADurb.Bin133]HNZ26059.1 ABC transporter permease [Spirochaetota bacterium]HOF00450.1 ABC transporter permease [Spirochaetota bacterium]HOS31625.1 ABC transporter permease [Spirochaetota bacterium]HOS54923.1 ABC transporter permease [Spirochaetota bacterium]